MKPFLALAAFLPFTVIASETDSFSQRHEMLSDDFPAINTILNNITNARINQALSNLRSSCNKMDLEGAFLRAVGDVHLGPINTMVGALETDLNDGFSDYFKDANGTKLPLPTKKQDLKAHIYRSFDIIAEMGFATSRLKSFSTMKLTDREGRDLIVGVDKLTHFFSQGKEYYDVVQAQVQRVAESSLNPAWMSQVGAQRALLYGIETEIGKYGFGIGEAIAGTGVFSYADLATNYGGLQFWFSFSSEHGNDRSPMFVCENDKWVQQRPFAWEDHITPAWDESINGNEFFKKSMQEKFQNALRHLKEQKLIPRDTVPLEPSYCSSLAKMYAHPEALQFILNPSCYDLAK